MTIGDFAIGGDACTRTDQEEVAVLQFGDGNRLSLIAMLDALGGIGHKFGEFVERAGGLTHGTHLQPVTEEHDVDERDEFPEETFAEINELCRDAVNECN